MLAFKLMAIFAVAYAQMSSVAAAPEERNRMDVISFSLNVDMARESSSGGHEEIPKEMVKSGSDESEPQESTILKTAAPEIPSASQQTTAGPETTTEAEVTSVESATVTLPAASLAEYGAFWVSDYSEAEKQFLIRFTETNFEDCSQKIKRERLEDWMELSFSMEDGVCTLYTYAPVNRSDIGPPPKKDGNDKILYVKKTPTDLCTDEFEGEIIQWPNNTAILLAKAESIYCTMFICREGDITHRASGIKFGDGKCLGTRGNIQTTAGEQATQFYPDGFALFNIFSDADEQTFDSYGNWAYLSNGPSSSTVVDVEYDFGVGEYRWRQSLRLIPDNSSLWADDHPSPSRNLCVAVFDEGLKDVDCDDDFNRGSYLITLRYNIKRL